MESNSTSSRRVAVLSNSKIANQLQTPAAKVSRRGQKSLKTSFIGHAMGAAGALELLGNIPAFDDDFAHATINLDELDSRVPLTQVVANQPRKMDAVNCILNNSFGMLGINSVLIVKKFNPKA